MQPSSFSFGPETLALMGRVCDEAWREIQTKSFFSSLGDATEIRGQLARRVMAAVVDGEHDPQRLKAIAVQSIEG